MISSPQKILGQTKTNNNNLIVGHTKSFLIVLALAAYCGGVISMQNNLSALLSDLIAPRPTNNVVTAAVTNPAINQKFAVANFVESLDQLYGVYSIHNQLIKYNMTNNRIDGGSSGISHVAVVPNDIEEKYYNTLVSWLGKDYVHTVNKGYILNRMKDEQGMWMGTFNKLWLFNLTEYTKVIILDTDILIRSNILHWYDYPTPCGIQAEDNIAWNSGALVITPNTTIFEQMMHMLPHIQRYERDANYTNDPLNGGYSDQDFISAFFSHNVEQSKQRCVMPTEAAVLSGSLRNIVFFKYYNEYRPWVYQTVHFTHGKPWREGVQADDPFLCTLFQEWNESMRGIEKYYGDDKDNAIEPIQNDYLAKCRDAGYVPL